MSACAVAGASCCGVVFRREARPRWRGQSAGLFERIGVPQPERYYRQQNENHAREPYLAVLLLSAPCRERDYRNLRKPRPEDNTYRSLAVHRPAVCIQKRRERTHSKLECRHNHRGQGNREHNPDDSERNPVPEVQERVENHSERGRDAADCDAQGCDRPDVDFLAVLCCGGLLGRQVGHYLGVRVGGVFCDLLARPLHEPLVRRPERLPQPHGVLDNLDDGCVPVASLSVVENSVAPDDQIVGVARSDDGGYVQVSLALALADAVEQVSVARRRHCRVLCDVVHFYAQPAVAAVDEEPAELENRVVRSAVERVEVHEVSQQLEEVFVEHYELFDLRDIVDVLAYFVVLFDEREQLFFVGFVDTRERLRPENRNAVVGARRRPRLVGREGCLDFRPARGVEHARSENRNGAGVAECGDCAGEYGVCRRAQIKPLVVDFRDGQIFQLFGHFGEALRFGENVADLLRLRVDGCRGGRVIGGEGGSGKIVVELFGDCVERGGRRCGFVSQRKDFFVRFRRAVPRQKFRALFEEGFYRVRVRAVAPRAVGLRAARFYYKRKCLRALCVAFAGKLGDYSVGVERGVGENLGFVVEVRNRNRAFSPPADIFQNLFGAVENSRADGRVAVYVRKFQLVRASEQRVGILQRGARPLAGGYDVVAAHSPVGVGVDYVESLFVERKSARRAAECRPKFHIQFPDCRDVRARGDFGLVHAARFEKAPVVFRVDLLHWFIGV